MANLSLFPVRVPIGRATDAAGNSLDVLMTPEFARALSSLFERVGGDSFEVEDFDLSPADSSISGAPPPSDPMVGFYPGEVEALRERVAALEGLLTQLLAPQPTDVYTPPVPDYGVSPVRVPTRNPRIDGSYADLWVPQQNNFFDNVLSLRNQSRKADGSLYGLAAICCLDAGGNERGAFGYSRNSVLQPSGYTPDIMYMEYGDPFANDGVPSSLQFICTMGATSPYFPGTTFVTFENNAKTGETSVRSRGGKPINLVGTTLVGDAFAPSANGKLQVRENTAEYVISSKNAASKEWVWAVSAGRMYLANATDAVSALQIFNAGRVAIGGATDDGATKFQVNGGGIKHSSAVLLSTSVALTNGAAAAAGTLSNAPVAGNPTKWVPINDNGTTRYIPTW